MLPSPGTQCQSRQWQVIEVETLSPVEPGLAGQQEMPCMRETGCCQEDEEEEGWWAWWLLATLEHREQQVQQPGQRPTVDRLPWPKVREEVLQSGQPRTKQLEPQKRTAPAAPCPLGLFTCSWACRMRPALCPRPPERRVAARSAMSHACHVCKPAHRGVDEQKRGTKANDTREPQIMRERGMERKVTGKSGLYKASVKFVTASTKWERKEPNLSGEVGRRGKRSGRKGAERRTVSVAEGNNQ